MTKTELCQEHSKFYKVALQILAHLFVNTRSLALGGMRVMGGREACWVWFVLFNHNRNRSKGDLIILPCTVLSAHLSPSPWTPNFCWALRTLTILFECYSLWLLCGRGSSEASECQEGTTPCFSGIAHSEMWSRSILLQSLSWWGSRFTLRSQHSCFVTHGRIIFSMFSPVKCIYLDDT